MEQIKHTPGPWTADIDSSHHRAVVRNGMEPLAEMWMTGKPQAEREANARLIAAAPELLEALDSLVSACELPGDHCEIEQALPAATAAIEKALGKAIGA